MDRSGLQSGSSTGGEPALDACRTELPVLNVGVVRERADAARNRLRILAAAERLFAARGVAGVTMDDVAAAAGVGKGTLYRRFVDKGGLAVALLDQRERELQQAILTGPPPLGPGATPPERLRSEEHTSELQSRPYLVCRLLLEKKNTTHDSEHKP